VHCKSSRIVDLYRKLRCFVDFKNNVDCGSAVTFGQDS